MKVLLINPPTPNIMRGALPPVIEDETGVYPPLGLLYVAAYVEEVDGCTVEVLDCQAERIDHTQLGDIIQKSAPDVVGIQAMTFTIIDAAIVAKTVREHMPEAFIVLGGPHATIYPAQTVQIPQVDVVIAGEGEYSFTALLRAIKNRQPPEDVSGVMTKQNCHLPLRWEHIQDLDELKMPARHLIDNHKYSSSLAKKNPLTTIMSSRGCPARCVFCDRPQMGKIFRKRSAENVVSEMRYCKEYFGIAEFMFYDDTFTINRQRVLDICDIIIEESLEVFWDIRARVDTVTPEMIHKLRKAGCHRIHYGVETGSPRIQKRLEKNLDLNKVKEIFHLTKKEGIETLGYFMIGCPDETTDDMKATVEFMLSLPMDYAHISIFTPFPGTRIYMEALESGFYESDYWKEFALDPKPEFVPEYWNQYFTNEELFYHLKKAYHRFYARPRYLLNRMLKIRSVGELVRKTTVGFKLLRSTFGN
jgi:anaerobic magnesium-protoporphyrin IX monomethyl ester cyclase